MNSLPLLLHLLLLDSALGSFLPAPVNLSVNSVNFRHVLHWDPGPGTPPGTQYMIYKIISTKKGQQRKWLANSRTTSVQLKLKDPKDIYYLTVVASYNHTVSPESPKRRFAPYEETKIGPPKVSLAGCGNCIHVNISLPETDSRSGLDDIHNLYRPTYKVFFKKHGGKNSTYITENRISTLTNLHNGTEYCVQVHTMIRLNKNTEPSAWTCTFTSRLEPSRGPVIVGTVAALVIFVLGGLMASMLCLQYTGFICKLKATLPRALMVALSRGYTLRPERTIPDLVSISPEMEKLRRHNNPTAPQAATGGANSEEEDEEEEEEGTNVYLDRAAELFSGESSCKVSGDVSGSRTPAVAEHSGSLRVEVTHEDEAKDEGAEVPLIPEEAQTGVQGHVTGEVVEEKEEDSSGDVDLFSVTLAALASCEEEEQNTGDSLTDGLKLSNLEPLLPTESHDRTAVAVTQHGETEEEEEEEEFSGYIRHT